MNSHHQFPLDPTLRPVVPLDTTEEVTEDITEQPQAEGDLNPAGDFAAAILDTIAALVVVTDRQGRIIRFNRAAEQLSAYTAEEVQGQVIWDFLFPPAEVGIVRAIFAEILNGCGPSTCENHWLSKTGSQYLISWTNTALMDETREINYVIGSGIDITENRQNQTQLEHQNRQSQLLAGVTRKMGQSLKLQNILQTATLEVRRLLACDRIAIIKAQADGSGCLVAEAVSEPGWALTNGASRPFQYPSEYFNYYRHRSISVISDYQDLETASQIRAQLQALGVKSELAVPIFKQSQFWGILAVHFCGQLRQWNLLEQNLVRQLADQLSLAIEQAELFDTLEEEVEQRTTELTRINRQLQQEIIDRQQIELALRESEKKFAGILDIAGEAILSINSQQQICLFNQEAERIFGYTADEVMGQSLDLLIPVAVRDIHRRHVQEFDQTGSISRRMTERTRQICGRRKNGNEFLVEASISKLNTADGPLFTVMLKDITEQLQAEMALRRSEEQLRLITNALPVMICYVDAEQRYRFNNRAYEDWFGIPYTQIEGVQVRTLLGERTYQIIQPYLLKALAGEATTFEAEMPHQDGKRRWVNIHYIPDIEADRVKGYFALVSDISDRKATDRLKDEFVSVVSHELRTPLTSVHGSLKLLATGELGQLKDQGQTLLEIALKNTERLTRLINDVLDLERIQSGQVVMAKEYCSTLDLVNRATQSMQAMANEYGIEINVSAEPAMLWVDPDHIEQTLTNLLSNAIKFSPKGTKVRVTATDQADQVLFKVIDRGRGIPEKALSIVFERFQQVDASDSRIHGGTGLGLAICREIVQRHQGRIWVTSIHGQGSTFCFTLPKKPNDV